MNRIIEGGIRLFSLALSFVGFTFAGRHSPQREGDRPKSKQIEPPPKMVNPLDTLLVDALAAGRAAADASGASRPTPVIQKGLRDRFHNLIVAISRGPFDPTKSDDDAALKEKLDYSKSSVERRTDTVERAKVEVARRREAVVAPEPRPRVSPVMIAVYVLGYAIGFAATLSVLPMFTAITDEDPVLSLLLTGTIGVIFGLLAVVSQFDLYPLADRESPQRVDQSGGLGWPLAAGIAMTLAFGLMRGAAVLGAGTSVEMAQEGLITIALVILDLSILAYTKASAVRHHARVASWASRQADRIQHEKAYVDAVRLAETAELDLAAADADLEVARSERAARELLNLDLEGVSAWIGDEAIAAYLKRVDEIAASQQLIARRWKS